MKFTGMCVAHLAAVAATRVRIPASCQILYLNFKTRDRVRDPGTQRSFLKEIYKGEIFPVETFSRCHHVKNILLPSLNLIPIIYFSSLSFQKSFVVVALSAKLTKECLLVPRLPSALPTYFPYEDDNCCRRV